jgi:CDP-glycerol glycerophosphotransferase (TagB/SpsB family)
MRIIRLKRRRLAEALLQALLFPIYFLVRLIPRDRQLVVFGSATGWHFADNSKYLFLHISAEVPEIKPVFISKNRDVVSTIRERGLRAEFMYSPAGLATVVRAHTAFLSHSTEDIDQVLLSGARIVQLWHGTPIRKIVHDCDWSPLSPDNFDLKTRLKISILRMLWRIFPYTHGQDTFDQIVICSEAVIPGFRTAFRVPAQKMVVLGQPRNDLLTSGTDPDPRFFPETEWLDRLREEASIIVSWLPTHRAEERAGIIDFLSGYDFDAEALSRLCGKYNIKLVVKPHYLVKEQVADRLTAHENLLVYEHVDPYPLLRRTDILITDYSSVFLDFLLLDRPVIFTPFDLEDYLKHSATMYYDYDEITPGPKCRNWIDLVRELELAVAARTGEGPDQWREQRRIIGDRFNQFRGDFCRRVVEEFLT